MPENQNPDVIAADQDPRYQQQLRDLREMTDALNAAAPAAPLGMEAVGVPELKKFTVLAFVDESGQGVCHHVEAASGMQAFYKVAEDDPGLTFVAALPGHLMDSSDDVCFPGEGVVDAETVLDQPEVFNVTPRGDAVVQPSLEASLPAQSGYEKGYRDALESLSLALRDRLSPSAMRDALQTALDAYANNAEADGEAPVADSPTA